MACRDDALENELKLTVYESMFSGSERSLSFSTVVFAEPALPTSMTGAAIGSSRSSRKVRRVVSIVGTTIDAKAAPPRCVYDAMRSRQWRIRRSPAPLSST